ncbi:MAG: Fe-S cluster assembly protein SufD [Acidobacteria bacterium]|jgi:Fe-S cluster assembly protein SufD|nr:Fe-S cluster assembly protein SufD [Acidobacteriota bacterium]
MTQTTAFSDALDAAAALPAPELLQGLRLKGRESFAEQGLPNRRQEAWRFTRLTGIGDTDFVAPRAVAPRVDVTQWQLADAHLLVFVDGISSPDVSQIGDRPDGVVVSNLVIGATSGSETVAQHLGSLAPLDQHPFAALNSALIADGAFIHLPTGVELERPIQLIFVSGTDARPTLNAPRILIVAEAGSRATVVEHHVGKVSSLSCPVTEVVLAENSTLDHVIVQEEHPSAHHLAVRQARLAAGSRYSAQAISLGGALARTDIGVVLEGEGANASLDGLYLGDDKQQADTHLTMRHASPNCESHQLYKGILGGRAKAVFNGRIIVDQDAQKTDANQSNRNLLLSEDAVVNSNPQLEIFADDVRCTHGSTVGQLDEEAVFYLRSRGIGRDEAAQLLTLAFAGEILDRIPVTDLRQRLEDVVAERLAAMTDKANSE